MVKEKLQAHIDALKHRHRILDERITELDCQYDEYPYCSELKKKRLKIKEEILRCETELEKL